MLTALQARPASPLAAGLASRFDAVPGGLEPRFDAAAGPVTARVLLPQRATASKYLEDRASGMAIDVTLVGAKPEASQAADGYLVYPSAHLGGATLLEHPSPIGSEDFVSFAWRPATPEVSYEVGLLNGVAGLRLVDRTLELLDAQGAPRLRVSPPFVTGAGGVRTEAALAIAGCAFDANPAAPWGRSVTAPGATRCTLRVSWDDGAVAYPAVLDPSWTTTGSMITPRQNHTATLLSTGKVLVAGGTNGSTVLASAELYDRTTGTWAATGSMTGARQLHSATRLNTSSNPTTSGAVLVAGGLNGTTSQSTAQLYSTTAGTWSAAANLNAARHGHTATLLADGRVLVAGGLNGTTTLTSAALYNPASGTGAWTATTGPIPPPGQKAHTATLLVTSNQQLSNKVLLVGGNNGTSTMSSVYLFDPVQSAFSTLAAMPSPREGHTATVLANGNILFTGGKNGTSTLATAVIFNPSSGPGSWTAAGTMTSPRQGHTATLIPAGLSTNGQVLIAGGSNGTSTLASAELFSGTSTFSATAAMPAPVQGHTATALANGAILIAGGVNGTTTLSAARLYDASFGLGCTSNSQCATGFCANGVCCNTACTDQCSACNLTGSVGTCSPKPNGATCSDGNACTQTDTCQSGVCTGANPKVCTASDQCHAAGTCAPSTGVCSNPALSNGTSCNDGNACTQTDTCQSGVCTGGNPKTCTASDQCHTAGTCNQTTGVCTNPTLADGTSCNDGNACTQTDTCQAGVCTGANPVTCGIPTQCHVAGSCDPSTGVCSTPNAPDGSLCNDGSICTQTDTCQGGTCVGRNPVVCQPLDACHVAGTCLAPTGCTNPPASDGTTCSDGNACTVGDSCQSGSCQSGPAVTCSASDTCHGAGSCDPTSGACPNPVLADGTSCEDGNPCTSGEVCAAGSCGGGQLKSCPAPDQCHTAGACDSRTGECLNEVLTDGTSCTDSDACTQGDICLSGSCVPGVPTVCPPLDGCHVAGACNSTTGACSNPVSTDPSCTGAPPPVVVPQPQNLPGMVPIEIAGLDPATATLTVTPAPNVGAGNPSPPQKQVIPALLGGAIECLADFNADGATDIVFANQSAGTLQVLPRLAAEVAAYDTNPVTIDAAMPAGAPGPAACADVDGDGNMDVVISFATPDGSGGTTPTLMLYRAQGNGAGLHFQKITIGHGFPSGVVTGGLGLADFDGDGKPDLAVYAANSQLLGAQIFVFPNQGLTDLVDSGMLGQPFSQSTRIAVPATDSMADASLPTWGALTIRDWDGDGHPDIWALGNRGTLNLFRSLGGFQFAAPEIDGIIQVPSRFAMDSFDANADNIPDLLVSGLDAGATPQLFVSAGGGGGEIYIPPVGGILPPATGQPMPGTHASHPLTWTVVNSPTPLPDAGIGLVKESPLVTYYLDSRGVQMPSILAQAVNGHLLERVGQNQSTTTLVPTSGPIQVQTLDGATITVTQTRTQTDSVSYTWIDHGVPAASGQGLTQHQTIVASKPAVAFEQVGSTILRRIYVRGLDGHLWELDQQNGTEQWVDDGLPLPNIPQGLPDPTGGAIVPLVGAPSAVAGFVGRQLRTFVYILDAAGRLDSFHISNDDIEWRTAGPIGSNNCFGTPGTLGEGSPKAINYLTITFTQQTFFGFPIGVAVPHLDFHHEVFVVGAAGDLFSWQDGNWEEILDAQYGVKFNSVVPPRPPQGFDPSQFTAVPVCPNGPLPNPALPEELVYQPGYTRPFALRGTPDVAVWTTTLCLGSGTACFSQQTREVIVRGDSGKLYAFDILGTSTNFASLTNPPKLDLSSTAPGFNPYVRVGQQTTGVITLQPPYCALTGGAPIQDSIISDPGVVMDLDGSVTVLATSIEHHLTMYHRTPVTRLFSPPSSTDAQWEKHPIPAPQTKSDGYSSGIIGVAGAIPGVQPTQPASIGSPSVPSLDIFAIRSDGILAEANSAADANGNWQSAEPDTKCSYFGDFGNGGTFQWLTDAAHDHTPALAPAILDHVAGSNDNPNSPAATNGSQCFTNSVMFSIFPQWTSVQRQNPTYHDLEFGTSPSPPFNQGYNDDVMVEVEGTVVDSHIAAIDNIINHTHGEDSMDIPLVHHDWNIIIAPDVQYQKLLTDANMLEGGVMELEWEMADHLGCTLSVRGLCLQYQLVQPSDSPLLAPRDRAAITADAIPAIGDRVAVRGRFIFDCGHPPFRAEIHPIDSIAVIHHSDYANVRFSNNGGYAWYQPGDVNLKEDERCQLDTRFTDFANELLSKPNVTGWGPLNDLVSDVEWAEKIVNEGEFIDGGCHRTFDTDLVSPTALAKDNINSKTCYVHYDHPMNDMFPNDSTAAGLRYIPLVFPLSNPFEFTVPGGPQIIPEFSAESGTTTQVYNSGATPTALSVCFQRNVIKKHDNQDPGFFSLCDTDTRQELVTWITANGQSRLYVDGGDNCLSLNVYPDDTLTVGSHGFECDFSCGEHWDDDFTAAADDRIGFTRASFTQNMNWGLPGVSLGGITFTGTYRLTSQPDLATTKSRQSSAGDYTMTVTISAP